MSRGFLEDKEVRTLRVNVKSSLSFSVCHIVSGKICRELTARIARKLSWFLNVNRDIRKGDRATLIYEHQPADNHMRILKLQYRSRYLGKTLEMNFFKTPEMHHGSYFDSRGREIIARLQDRNAPIRDYSEITALPGEIRQGSGHSGTDFKAEAGTPVYASFEGRVSRVNWNIKKNGLCVEIDHPDKKVKTLYLHLDRVLVRAGQWVGRAAKIGLSGNTGHSFAPHLHYEIKSRDSKKTVYNPFHFKYHKKYSRTITRKYRKDFLDQVRQYDSLLQTG
ncbi:MAG: peptidoglycan DD-metalloendopeptidase family protein [Nitrospinaceae bacterium]|nr:peptidoglycan DD-metalloendopeptidase family protein [Nitrospinaceae bacterium]